MYSLRAFSIGVIARVVVSGFAVVLCTGLTAAQRNSDDYVFLVASGFLCDPGDSSTCPATVKGTQGDTYEISGAGSFEAQSKSVKAVGTFNHKSSNGSLLETGIWIAGELLSFKSYGAAPTAIPRLGSALGAGPFSPRHLPISLSPMPTGGLAVFHIRLLPIQGPSRIAVLQVNCALGEVPRERSVEGIRLKREGNDAEYAEYLEELGGRVMFLAMRPEVSTPAKAPEQEKAPETSGQPHN